MGTMKSSLEQLKSVSQQWFETLRDQILLSLEELESEFSSAHFVKTPWARAKVEELYLESKRK